jgi:hypothetical protein
MVLVGDDTHVDAHLGLFADRANLDARNLHGFAELVGHVDACFSPFVDSANLAQDRCMVCVERTIRSENHCWTHPMVLLGVDAQVDARFGPFGDSTNLGAR